MITREIAAMAATELHNLAGVSRVFLAGRDGIPLYDDRSLVEREHAAAATATAVGVSEIICEGVELGGVEGGIVFGEHGVLVFRPLEAPYVLAVVADDSIDLTGLYRHMRKQARALDRADVGERST